MCWNVSDFIFRASAHEAPISRRPSSADARRAGIEIDIPDFSASRRLVPCCAFCTGKGFAPLVVAPEEAHERWEARCEFPAWTEM